MLENTQKKFSHVLSQMMEDIFFLQELTELSNYGMLEDNVDIQFKTIIIKIGFQKLDIFQPPTKAVLLDISLPQLDGMDILKSGIIKLSTLKIALKLMMLILTALLFPQEETSLSLEEKIKKLKYMISQM